MGSSLSSESGPNRNTHHHYHRPHHPPPYYPAAPPPQPPYFHPTSSPQPPLPPPNTNYGYASSNPYPNPNPPTTTTTAPPNNYGYASSNPYPNPTTTTTPQYNYDYPPPIPSNYYYPGWQNSFNYPNPLMSRPNYAYSYVNHGNGWPPMGPPMNSGPPPVYVDHQNAKVVKNDVNVHKGTIRLEVDENYPDHHLVSFVFDARFDGSITIYYFAKEEKESGKFIPVCPAAPRPVKVPFWEGAGQRFHQPSGTGVNLHHFDLKALGKPSADGASPLVIFAEVTSSSQAADDETAEASKRAQITHAVIERQNNGSFGVKVIKQIVSIDGEEYEVRELYGIGSSSAEGFNDDDPGKECVICMTEPKNTAVMPCRHLCMCSDCAKELRLQTKKCPICREEITELIEIKINNTGDH